ncbi:TPA: hypothetical protein DCQ44_02595 [Candidatus Taylorbacteria bacterium]|nr:hypothetical protein [Candidatus Taylorbacteria bacterium]
MKTNKNGYILPVAIAVLVIASLGLLLFSWLSKSDKSNIADDNSKQSSSVTSTTTGQSSATDDATLNNDSTTIDGQIKALDNDNSSIDSSLNDKSTI